MSSGTLTIAKAGEGRYRLELSLDVQLSPGLSSGRSSTNAGDVSQPASDGREEDGRPKLALTVEEVADQLDIGRDAVYDLLRSGQLESIKIGRLRRIPLSCLHRYVEHQLIEGR